jgi:CCR4-NOT transcription complex subunit 2
MDAVRKSQGDGGLRHSGNVNVNVNLQPHPQLQAQLQAQAQPQMQAKRALVADRFGLLGLLSVIRMTDADLSMLALGTDLTTLGLSLNSAE